MISKKYFKQSNYANRGMILENDLNETNKYYLQNNIAVIYKKPTPIKVVNVEYPKNIIREAYFSEPSTLDYIGIYKEKYIEFDAKETISKTSFPISNIHKHQLEHIKRIIKFGGITFLIVRFTSLNETYLLLGSDLLDFINNNKRKSIPINYFKERGFYIEFKYAPRLDYIKIIDKLLR
ncbi:MAG: recombination protein U [Bacilli bacterium]|nr:recombination protein U [Bacilli bacterium]